MTRSLMIGLFLINLLSFTVFGLDKLQARRGGRRVSEAALLALALPLAAGGELLAMVLFRHKTLHKKFSWGLPLLLLLQMLAVTYLGLRQ